MKKIFFLLLALIACLAIQAERVTEQEALQKAQKFMQGKKFKTKNLRRAPSLDASNNAYYVFNVENDNGFVIVAGDDRMPDILGYSEKGSNNTHSIPCNMEWLMNCYTQTLDSLNAYGITQKWSARRSNNNATIEPLITTTWGQHAPYNKYCPEIEGKKCPTGCVATAMAQIINYKKWPQGETAAVEAYTTGSGISMPALEPTTFEWSNMTDDDIARLMLYCGQSAKMNYLLSGSGAAEPSDALKRIFGYSNSTKSWLIKLFEAEHLEQTIYDELAEDRPVFYTGYSSSKGEGHAFIVDGYKDGMFHINWGWDGDADGYFIITGLTEDVMPFLPNCGSDMIVGIEPPAPNSEQAKAIVYDFQYGGYRVSYRTNASEDFLFPTSFYGRFSCDYNSSCYIGLGFYHDNELVKVVAQQQVLFPMDDFLYFDNVYIEKNIPQGTYTVCPVYRHGETEEWRKTIGSNQHCMIAHVGDKSCYFEHFVDEWDGHFQDYGYQEINGVTYGLTFEFNTNWAYVLPYQLTGKYRGEIVIPNKVVYDGKVFLVREERESPFLGCSDLHSLSAAIDRSIRIIDCANLAQLNLQQGHYITIANCPKLENIEIPVTTQSVTVDWCQKLKTIKFTNIVPYGVPSFSEYQFSSLTDVYFASATPPEVLGYEDRIPNNPHVTIHVPKGSTIVYKNSQWKEWNIVDDNMEVSLVKWGYCHSDKVGFSGITQGNKGENIDQELAMRIAPEDLVAYIGSKITHIEVFSPERSINDWGYEDYEYVFITKRGKDYLVKQPFQVIRGAWNNIKLDKPYTITGEELFVGFGRRGQLGILFSDDTFVPDAAWERYMGEGSSPYAVLGKWDYSKECGTEGPSEIFAHPLPLRFSIEGDNVPEGVVLRELEIEDVGHEEPVLAPSRRAAKKDITIKGVIRNRSLETVTSYTIEWSIDGGEKHSKTFQTILAPNATENIKLEIPAITTAGTHLISTNVTMVNENANQLEGLNMPIIEYIVAGTFKLTYMVDNEEYKSYDIEYGASITPEAEPTKKGHTFSGWSEIPVTMPAHDVTVTGTFSINKYKLTYMVDGEVYNTYDVEYGATITPEITPMKEGYTFSGWSTIPETMPAHDVTVTGSFTVNKYKLIYMVDGEVYRNCVFMYGEVVIPEAEPTKEGYTFSGWSEIPAIMPAHDVTVTGTFIPETDIKLIMSTENSSVMIFTIDGKRVKNLKKGMNVIRMKNGTMRKVVVK